MQRVRPTINGISNTNRSRVSNGTKLLAGIDGRSPQARRFRDLILGYTAEFEVASEFDKALIRQAAFLVIKAEDLQAKTLRGEDVASDEIVRLSGQLGRVLAALKRRSNADAPAAPSITEHWDAKLATTRSTAGLAHGPAGGERRQDAVKK